LILKLCNIFMQVSEMLAQQHATIARLESQATAVKSPLEELTSRLSCNPVHPAFKGYEPQAAAGPGRYETFRDGPPPPPSRPASTTQAPKPKRKRKPHKPAPTPSNSPANQKGDEHLKTNFGAAMESSANEARSPSVLTPPQPDTPVGSPSSAPENQPTADPSQNPEAEPSSVAENNKVPLVETSETPGTGPHSVSSAEAPVVGPTVTPPSSNPAPEVRPETAMEEPAVSKYRMSRELNSVADVWKEFTVGWKGNPAVRELKWRYGTDWYPDKGERQYCSERQTIYKEVERQRNITGWSYEVLVEEIDNEREKNSVSLSRYMESLAKSKEDEKANRLKG
jgi:hypothetical protein